MTKPLIEIDAVTKQFGEYTAVTQTSFNIERGEFLAIMGSSGCGKTTMLRMLAGLEEPTSGEIRLDGVSQNGLPPWERELPLVWQSLALFPFLSVLDNVAFGLKMRGVSKKIRHERARNWINKFPEADRRLKHAKAALVELSEAKLVPLENLLTPELLRQVSFAPPENLSSKTLSERLTQLGARPWQIELTADLIVGAFNLAEKAPADPITSNLPEPDEHEEP